MKSVVPLERRRETNDQLFAAMSLTIVVSIEAKLKTAIAAGVVTCDKGFKDGFV